ncbi:hypothetical protein RRG08_031397 [Elysia crispata]|uniref:Secreted protein n=1 Tax=Elysia crispata TaxID=231223 RepID=A0AAE0ZMV4_9GAST|nr:hypothetical protein RRG08_031397 [Elysia crispata]
MIFLTRSGVGSFCFLLDLAFFLRFPNSALTFALYPLNLDPVTNNYDLSSSLNPPQETSLGINTLLCTSLSWRCVVRETSLDWSVYSWRL